MSIFGKINFDLKTSFSKSVELPLPKKSRLRILPAAPKTAPSREREIIRIIIIKF